jgi:hypothetical protein
MTIWIKKPGEPIPSQTIVEAMNLYHAYAQSQVNSEKPVSTISFEPGTPESKAVKVRIDVSFKGTTFNIRSIESSDAPDVYKYLTSQPIVCSKYANKKISTFEATQARVKQLADRFDPETEESKKGLFMHGGFVVTGTNNEFLGMINTGASDADGYTEIGVRFRADAWSHRPENLEQEYNIEPEERLETNYQGLGTVAVCALWDYTRATAERGYQIKGHDVIGMRAVSMIDNPGGWQALVKAGMQVRDVDAVESYGPEIRFQTQKKLSI